MPTDEELYPGKIMKFGSGPFPHLRHYNFPDVELIEKTGEHSWRIKIIKDGYIIEIDSLALYSLDFDYSIFGWDKRDKPWWYKMFGRW